MGGNGRRPFSLLGTLASRRARSRFPLLRAGGLGMGCNNGRGRGAVRAGGRLPLGMLVCGGVALNALALPAAAIDFNGSESAGDAVIDNSIEGVNFNEQSTAGSATINNSFSGLTFFNDQS